MSLRCASKGTCIVAVSIIYAANRLRQNWLTWTYNTVLQSSTGGVGEGCFCCVSLLLDVKAWAASGDSGGNEWHTRYDEFEDKAGCVLSRFLGISRSVAVQALLSVYSHSTAVFQSAITVYWSGQLHGALRNVRDSFLLADGSWIPEAQKHCNLLLLLLILSLNSCAVCCVRKVREFSPRLKAFFLVYW